VKEFKDIMLVSTHERFGYLDIMRSLVHAGKKRQGNLLRKSESPETAMLGGWGT